MIIRCYLCSTNVDVVSHVKCKIQSATHQWQRNLVTDDHLSSPSITLLLYTSLSKNKMLKRQRPASPPSIPTIPLAIDESPFEIAYHQSKRRRVLPPVLDGQMRGWGKTDHEDDDEQECEKEDPGNATNIDGGFTDTTGYKSANGVLYELHELHRRRYLSSSSSSLSHPPTICSPQIHDKNGTLAAQLWPSGLNLELEGPENVTPTDELSRVTERYEESNRYDKVVIRHVVCLAHYT